MATKTLYFKGITKWCKVRKPDEKYDTYQVPLYMTDSEFLKYDASGIQLKKREDEDGAFVVFKRKHVEYNGLLKEQVTNGPPGILKDGVDFPDGLIGNGSEVTVKVEVYDTPKRGPGTKGHRLIAINVEKLVEYTPPTDSLDMVKMPF